MTFLIAAATGVARAVYAVLTALLPTRRKVVFLSRQSDAPSTDFVLLAAEMRRRDPSVELVIRCKMLRPGLGARVGYLLETLAQMYHLATAQACVVEGYVIPVSLLDHGNRLFVLQVWHAVGAVKQFGYQTIGRAQGRAAELAASMRMHRNYDLVTCCGPATVPIFASAFDVEPSRVKVLGMPRLDYLLAHRDDRAAVPATRAAAAVSERIPGALEKDRTVVLYAPTFRRQGSHGLEDVLTRFAGDGFAVLAKPHPLEGWCVERPGAADVGDLDVLDLLPLCDVLITDYSAVGLEALAIDTPVYFYVPDIDEYRASNGLNIDPLIEVPEISSRDIDRIAALIESGTYDAGAAARLKERFMTTADGRCTARLADAVLSHLGGGPDGR